jgi:translation initiation factor IF-3
LKIAEDAELDLVVVAAKSVPPVCRILDYGKLKYKEQKKAAEIRKKSAVQETKELRIRYNTDDHDLETKIKNATKFLEDGDKVRFSMRFKGRESMYENLGNEIFEQIIVRLQEVAQVDERTKLIGQKMMLVFAPKPNAKKK